MIAAFVVMLLLPAPVQAAAQWNFGTVGGGGFTPSSLIYAGEPHTFHYGGGDLLDSVWTGSAWVTNVLDGGGGPNGRVNADVGNTSAAVLVGGLPHVFYYDGTNGTLRHGAWSGSQWFFETLDGAGGPNGRIVANVGYTSSVVIYGGQPLVFYYDSTNGDLRHGIWSGSQWDFAYLDGGGGANGRVNADVGYTSAAVLVGGLPHAFYYDGTNGDLRHGAWSGSQWFFETLDGAGGPNGRIVANVGYASSVVIYGGQPLVFYYDSTNGDLRHGIWSGSQWDFAYLDGGGGANGRVNADVGYTSAAILYGGMPHAFYYDGTNGDLRHGAWSGSQWFFETLDGAGGPNGRIVANVGYTSSVVIYAGGPLVFYSDLTNGSLRDGAWG